MKKSVLILGIVAAILYKLVELLDKVIETKKEPMTLAKEMNLSASSVYKIIDKIKYSNLYQEKLMFVYPFVERAENNDIEAMDIIDEEGRYLYEKLYRDFPFEKYHM